ncbi:MAG TPA: MFS transporter [Candidatus Acidoferrum sp.]|nr:MFS transporter [Candidatus Acidoferrum sp.]
MLLGSRAAFAPILLMCYAITLALHVGSIALSTLLPFRMMEVGGSSTQVGLLFSVMTVVSMVLRPTIGGWVDRLGARRVLIPGVVALAFTSLALQLSATPPTLIALMVGLGLANALVSTPVSVLTAISTAPAHRGEALGTYYLASSIGIALAPPFAFGLQALGGMPLAFGAVTVVAIIIAWLVTRVPGGPSATVERIAARFRLVSAGALPVSGALMLATLGHSSFYAFLPLYALSRGRGAALAWFFGVYPLWMIACRVLWRGLADRVNRLHVALAAMVLQAVAYAILALPPAPVTLVVAAVILATGTAVLYPTLAALVVDRADATERGLALGTLSGSWDLGVVIGSALTGVVVDHVSYGAGFVVAAAGATLGALAFASIVLRRRSAVGASARPA